MRQLAAENAASIAGDDGTGRADTGVYFFGAEKRGGGGKGGEKALVIDCIVDFYFVQFASKCPKILFRNPKFIM